MEEGQGFHLQTPNEPSKRKGKAIGGGMWCCFHQDWWRARGALVDSCNNRQRSREGLVWATVPGKGAGVCMEVMGGKRSKK